MVALLAHLAFAAYTLSPSDDVWAYPHSSSPGQESILRVWGTGEKAVDAVSFEEGATSHGFMQFKLNDVKESELKSATLIVFADASESLTEEFVKKFPLEVYAMKGTLNEKEYQFDAQPVLPTEQLFGKATAEKVDGKWKLSIDLLSNKEGKFAEFFAEAKKSGNLGFTLASKVSPADRTGIYRVHSKESEEKFRPKLELVVE
jgi:hypothetical protein